MNETTLIDSVIPRTDVVIRAARIGAEIINFKLSGDLPDRTIAAINRPATCAQGPLFPRPRSSR